MADVNTASTKPSINFLIIGGGEVAVVAAEEIRKRGAGGRIMIVSPDHDRPYHRSPLSKGYLRGEVNRRDVFVQPADWYAANAVELVTDTHATALDPALCTVTLDNGRTLHYGTLLLATGGTSRHLDIPGVDLAGVHYLHSLADSESLRVAAAQAKRAAVIGGGFIGVEVATALTTYNVETTLIVGDETIWQDLVPPEVARFVEQTLNKQGVKLIIEDEATRILPRGGELHAGSVITKSGHSVAGDLVVIAIGSEPNISLAREAGLALDDATGGVIVDEYFGTSDPHVYAAGEIASFPDPVFGRCRVEHWDTEFSQGQTVGANMAGAREAYDHVQYVSSDVFDLRLELLGKPQASTPTLTRGSMESRSFAVLYLDGSQETVTGAFTVNRPVEELDSYRALIRQQVSLAGFESEAEQHPDEDLTGLAPDLGAAAAMETAEPEQE